MEISKIHDFIDDSSCTLEYDETNQWLRATWRGYVDDGEAIVGAVNYLRALENLHSPYLLNDNSGIEGPWFNSIDWLERTWLPRAAELGLRYVAHVVSPSGHDVLSTVTMRDPNSIQFELQIFDRVEDAEQWLHSCKSVNI